ncbi:MAG: ankyrin repeat domain-containing protein [Akkermansia sp.]|nr:ankyrin repeat domain-containing protein [Akkermansia sp.]
MRTLASIYTRRISVICVGTALLAGVAYVCFEPPPADNNIEQNKSKSQTGFTFSYARPQEEGEEHPDPVKEATTVHKLLQAAENGDTAILLQELAAGADINLESRTHDTPLLLATRNSHVECLKILLERGADTEARDNRGETALHLAAREGKAELLELLLQHKADIQARADHKTALHLAAQGNHLACIRSLLKAGSAHNATTQQGETPLFITADKGYSDCLQELIKAGADVNQANGKGTAPLIAALKSDHRDCVQKLLTAGASPDTTTPEQCPALLWAVNANQSYCADLLLQAGASPDITREDGSTALHIAAKQEYTECLQVLLAHGADCTLKDKNGNTPIDLLPPNGEQTNHQLLATAGLKKMGITPGDDKLMAQAAAEGNRSLLALMLAANESPTSRQAALAQAVIAGQTECLALLLAHGTNPNFHHSDGATPLHLAATNGHIACVQALLHANAAILATNADKKTAGEVAAANGQKECADVLTAAEDLAVNKKIQPHNYGSQLVKAARDNNISLLRQLLKVGTDLKDNPALAEAARKKREGSVHMLLLAGADPNTCGEDGKPAIELAAMAGSARCLRSLIEAGAELHSKNSPTSTLYTATLHGHLECVLLLLDKGLSPNETDERGRSLMQVAIEKNQPKIMMALIQKGADIEPSLLHAAAQSGNASCLKIIIDSGVRVDTLNEENETALAIAAEHGQAACITMLLKSGAFVNAKNKSGRTALHIAARHGHTDAVSALLKGYANINARDVANNTPLNYAQQHGHKECVKLLLNEEKSRNTGY